jgi:hypothetical protein
MAREGPVKIFVRWLTALIALPALLLGISAVSASAATSGKGWIRLAHLSPNTPAVDVYLYSFGDSSAELVLHHVGYGTWSPYQQVAAGEYTVAMRADGASPTSKPVLSTTVDVKAGHAYTVAGVGPESGIRLQVLNDKLTTPSGKSVVRVIQASLKEKQVTVTCNGKALVSDLGFAKVSSYKTVAATTATMRVTSAGSATSKNVTLAAGTVHTIVVLDGAKGLEIDNLTDAAGSTVDPAGGAATGFGGTAPRVPSPLPWVLVIVAGGLLLAASGLGLRGGLRYRPRSRA